MTGQKYIFIILSTWESLGLKPLMNQQLIRVMSSYDVDIALMNEGQCRQYCHLNTSA